MGELRNINGLDLARKLAVLGYEITRQKGSHIRLTTSKDGEHHETIPSHRPLKIGTLNAILKNIANHHKLTKDELIEKLGL